MERATPVRHTHNSTAGLLSWPETPSKNKSSSTATIPLSNQPSDGITQVLSGDQITGDEAESLNRSTTFKKNCSEHKLKEMFGHNIFEDESGVPPVHIVQQAANDISQISFSTQELSPQKPHSLTEAAKQRELCGTLETDLDSKIGKHFSHSKSKELIGHDIFGTPEPPPRAAAPPRAPPVNETQTQTQWDATPRHIRTSVKVSNPAGGLSNIMFGEESVKKIHNDVIKEDVHVGSTETPSSRAKLKEMSGSDIFSDGKAEPREFLGGRKPPGGDSSIQLI